MIIASWPSLSRGWRAFCSLLAAWPTLLLAWPMLVLASPASGVDCASNQAWSAPRQARPASARDRPRKPLPVTAVSQPIDVNQASLEDLRSIRGVGPARARRILAERAHGPFRDLADLSARVPGMGENTAQQLARQGLRVRAP